MKTNLKTQLVTVLGIGAVALATVTALAQGAGRGNRFLPAGGAANAAGETAAPTPGPRHPASPLVAALDANADGIIDAAEIANAAAVLKTLDKNGDGQLTVDEIRPAHAGARGGRGGRGGPKGPRGPQGECPANCPMNTETTTPE